MLQFSIAVGWTTVLLQRISCEIYRYNSVHISCCMYFNTRPLVRYKWILLLGQVDFQLTCLDRQAEILEKMSFIHNSKLIFIWAR